MQAEKAEASGRKVLLGTNGDYYSQSKTDDTWIPGGLVYKDGVALWTKLGWEADHAFICWMTEQPISRLLKSLML